MEEVFIHPCSKRTVMCLCGVIRCSGQGDRMLRSVHPPLCSLSCDRTLASLRSALTGCVWSQKLLSGTLLMLTERWNSASGHFAAQHPISSRNLTSVRSALTGRVRSALTGRFRSGFSLSGTLLELTRLWHPVSGHSPLSVRSLPNDFTLIK